MRILHLVSNWKLTGPVAPAIELAAALRARGHDVDVAIGRPIDKDVEPAGDHARGHGLKVVDQPAQAADVARIVEKPEVLRQHEVVDITSQR